MTRNKQCDCASLLNYFIHVLLRYDIKEKELSFYSFIINRNNTLYFTGSWALACITLLVACQFILNVCFM